LYSPESNLERNEVETLRTAKRSIDIAMYSFTDRELAQELVRLAGMGVRVRVYRDREEYEQENRRGQSTTEMLLAARIEVRIKASRDLMHLKSYVIDDVLLRTGSANWSPTGLKRQDNDVEYDADPIRARLFTARFAELWDRPGNLVFTNAGR
jgi:phosphatidylserine/phosphatidylglycerophosphate/cardiolipin synthase-like enzyme